MGRGVAGPRVGEKEKGGGVGPGREGKPGGWLATSGPSARVRGGVRLGFSSFFFLFYFLFQKPFPNKILSANKFKLEANNTK